METPALPATWSIATVKATTTFNRDTEETWFLNPVRRYVFHAQHLPVIEPMLASLSSVAGTPGYRPLQAGRSLAGKRIFMERFRGRGIGDLLFLTGPMAFLHHATGGDVKLHAYAFSDRGQVLRGSPLLEHGTTFLGPTHFDDFQHYDYQWLVETGTEGNEEADQLNVYDALYTQLGLDPAQVDPKFKRPQVSILPEDLDNLHRLWHAVWSDRDFDVRHTGYYVLAPFTHSALRCAPYAMWLELAAELARQRPVFIVGLAHEKLPVLDMAAGEFIQKVGALGGNVVSLLESRLALRSVMALISRATAFVGLDSGLLYVAQGCNTPAVSLWGPHDPGVRIGYDRDCMDLAIWNQADCANAACFAHRGFPAHKCPEGTAQKICQVLRGVTVDDVMKKIGLVESRRVRALGLFHPSK